MTFSLSIRTFAVLLLTSFLLGCDSTEPEPQLALGAFEALVTGSKPQYLDGTAMFEPVEDSERAEYLVRLTLPPDPRYPEAELGVFVVAWGGGRPGAFLISPGDPRNVARLVGRQQGDLVEYPIEFGDVTVEQYDGDTLSGSITLFSEMLGDPLDPTSVRIEGTFRAVRR